MGWVPFELRANGPGVGVVLLRGKLLPFASDSVSEVPFVAATKYIRQAPDAVGNRNFAAIRCCCDEPYIPVVSAQGTHWSQFRRRTALARSCVRMPRSPRGNGTVRGPMSAIFSRVKLATPAGPTRTGTNRWRETERLEQSIWGLLRMRAGSCRSPYRFYPAWFHLAG